MDISFATKSITFKGRQINILLPNARNSGALVALANVLLLDRNETENDQIKPLSRLVQKKHVLERDLVQVLASIQRGSLPENMDELGEKLAQVNIHDSHDNSQRTSLVSVLSPLNDVDPVFDGTFKNKSAMDVFHSYGVNLVHGWIMDKKEPLQISKLSYKEAVNANPPLDIDIGLDTQLTERGLEYLRASIREGSFAIIFRCNRFYTLHKHKGDLFYLVVDNNHPTAVWRALKSVDGTSYSGDFKAVQDDELTKNVQDWINATIASVYEPHRSKIEVEVKYGTMLHPGTKTRIKLPTSIPTIYKGQVKMKPNVDKGVFQEFKEYMNSAYHDRNVSSTTRDSLYRVNMGHRKVKFLRESVDLETNAVKEIIEKKSVSSLFIHRPKDLYDMKLSINLELPMLKKGILKNCGKPINIRQKNRTSYFKDLADCRIDVTDVQRKTNEFDKDGELEFTREIEVETSAQNLILAWEARNEKSFLFNQSVRILLNTANIVNEKLTFCLRI